MKIRLTETRARLATEVARLSQLYVITSQSEPKECRSEQGKKWLVYLTVIPRRGEGGEDLASIPVRVDDARLALEAFHVLAASSPSGMSPAMAAAAARITAQLPLPTPETTNLPAL